MTCSYTTVEKFGMYYSKIVKVNKFVMADLNQLKLDQVCKQNYVQTLFFLVSLSFEWEWRSRQVRACERLRFGRFSHLPCQLQVRVYDPHYLIFSGTHVLKSNLISRKMFG